MMADPPMTSNKPLTAVKQLRSSVPDLEVVIGSEQQIFRCHSVILASYSDYIDTMLSTPMKEQTTMRISFPDMDPEVWTKIIRFLEPAGSLGMSINDVTEVLPIYDQYGFQGGLNMCDGIIYRVLDSLMTPSQYYGIENNIDDVFAQAAVMSYNLNLPKSKRKSVEFAAMQVKSKNTGNMEDKSFIGLLLPLVQDDEATLRYMISTIMGKDDYMSVEEMNRVIGEESFAEEYTERFQHIKEQEQIFRNFTASPILHNAGSDVANGSYKGWDSRMAGKVGAMYRSFVKTTGNSLVVLEAMDPFGKSWRMVEKEVINAEDLDKDGEEFTEVLVNGAGTVLYKWKSDYSTMFLPKHGWQAEHGELPVPDLNYHLSHLR